MNELKDRALKQLIKAFKGTLPVGKIGILANSKRRDGGTNAEVGAAHEFGTEHLPVRSFLRVPLAENLDQRMEQAGAFDEKAIKEIIRSGHIRLYVQKISELSYAIVMEAFASEGFGKWAPWTTPGYTNNANQILVDTQQLRNSISVEVT